MEKKESSVKKFLVGDSSYNKLAIIGAILSFLGGIFIILPLVGFVLGIIALIQINKTKEKGKLVAVGAILIGGLQVFVFLSAFGTAVSGR